jgi:hypothetical protein
VVDVEVKLSVLEERLEHVSEQLRRLEDRTLTKWDVVSIFVWTIGSLGTLIGVF